MYSTYKNKPPLTKQRSNSRICVSIFIGEKIIVQMENDIIFFIQKFNLGLHYISNSNMTSFFRFVDKQAIYRLCIISLAHAPVHVTDFSVVNVHVDELSSARIWQHKLCATFSANVHINYRLPIKVYYRICTLRHQNRNKSWKPECVLSFNMGWRILVNCIPRLWLWIKY